MGESTNMAMRNHSTVAVVVPSVKNIVESKQGTTRITEIDTIKRFRKPAINLG